MQGTIGYFPTVPISGCSTAQINKSQKGDVLYASIVGPSILHLVDYSHQLKGCILARKMVC